MNPTDNKENIDKNYLSLLNELPLRERDRFLRGLFTDDNDDCLWTYEMIEKSYCFGFNEEYERIIIGIDPAITSHKDSDETGIIVAGELNGIYYIIDDKSGKYSPDGWANVVINLFDKYYCDRIIAEVNQGGDMVESILKNKRANIPVTKVRATRGKYVRAEPISSLYEQGKVKHVKRFNKLENQLLSISNEMNFSPDRGDALVWALTYLSGKKGITFGIIELG